MCTPWVSCHVDMLSLQHATPFMYGFLILCLRKISLVSRLELDSKITSDWLLWRRPVLAKGFTSANWMVEIHVCDTTEFFKCIGAHAKCWWCTAAVPSPFNFQRAQSFLATMATVHEKWRESRNSQGVREFSFTCRERLEKLLINLPKMLLEILKPYEFYCFYFNLAKERLIVLWAGNVDIFGFSLKWVVKTKGFTTHGY